MTAPDFAAALDAAERQQAITDLKAARAELAKRGRCKSTYVNRSGQVCTLGAIGCAVVEGFESLIPAAQGADMACNRRMRRAARELSKHLSDLRSMFDDDCDDVQLVWEFNDLDGVIDQDIFNLFDKALADLGGLG